MKFTEILGLVALALIFLRIYYLLHQKDGDTRRNIKYRVGPPGPALITVEQLTADCKEIYATFDVTIIPGAGVCISRMPHSGCVVVLREGMDCTWTVGVPHARLGHDPKGFFLQDCSAEYKLYTDEGVTEQVDIIDGMVVWLNQQPLRFRIPAE